MRWQATEANAATKQAERVPKQTVPEPPHPRCLFLGCLWPQSRHFSPGAGGVTVTW